MTGDGLRFAVQGAELAAAAALHALSRGWAGVHARLAAQIEAEDSHFFPQMRSAEAKEAFTAFFEKRPPNFPPPRD